MIEFSELIYGQETIFFNDQYHKQLSDEIIFEGKFIIYHRQ